MKNLSIRKNNEFEFNPFGSFDSLFRPWFNNDFDMKTDIKEVDDKYVLEMDLPGFDKKDLNISVEDGYLEVSASKSEESEQTEKDKYVHRERRYGTVSRSFYVGDLKEEDFTASYANGVLSVSFPKDCPPKDNKKRINID